LWREYQTKREWCEVGVIAQRILNVAQELIPVE
jgi:hypothetical protein